MTQTTDTAPAPAAPPQGPDLLDVAAAQAAALLLIELEAAATVSWPLRAALRWIEQQARGRFLVAESFGGPAAVDAARAWTTEQLRQAAHDYLRRDAVVPQLRAAAERAEQTGRANVAEQAAAQGRTVAAPSVSLAPALEATVPLFGLAPAPAPPAVTGPAARVLPNPTEAVARSAHETATGRIQQAVTALVDAQRPADLDQVFAIATRAPDDLGLAAAWLVNQRANAIARDESIRLGAKLLWIAERDACVVCLALSGHTANVLEGEGFDEFATFGPGRPSEPWPPGRGLTGPPRHPHCRCQAVVYFGVQAGQPDLAAVLRREAIRSILRGFSRPSESHRTRLVAAEKLLRSGQAAAAPKSVRAYAASAVEAGRFPTRAVPTRPARQPRRAA